MNKITEKELERAMKLAGRKSGVTRKQLAETMGIPDSRARLILGRLGKRVKSRPAGVGAGKANRALVYTA